MPIGISKARWELIQGALEDVLDQPEDKQLSYLKKYEDDSQLHKELVYLIGNSKDKLTLLDKPAFELISQVFTIDSDNSNIHSSELTELEENFNTSIPGKYQLCEEIGRGGMGVVYRARQINDSFEKQVAIKLLSINHRDRQVLQRFEKEQKLLASLKHHNIAQLYDGGMTDKNVPFFVMEYVEGEPIDRYCDSRKLSLKERLILILQVADALSFAHSNLIVHRDIKPSNILVTESGEIKLLDFGIAKLINEEKDHQLTRTGNQVLTPGFAAPEQLLEQPITVATDIYLLGLVTYYLLTGRQAYQDKAGSLIEIARVMCEEEPTKPSLINKKLTAGSDDLYFSNRMLTPKQLEKQLSGDLDAILMKALNNRPENRYSSVSGLKSDIQAFFNNEPIIAQHATTFYQGKKYIQRHWKGLGAIFIFIITLASYALTVTIQSGIISAALSQSEFEKKKAQQVSDFMINIFKAADPNISGLKKITADELLNQGHQKILRDLDSAPEIQGHMLTNLGEIYFSQGDVDRSIQLLESSLARQRSSGMSENLTLANTLTHLGVAYINTNKLDSAGVLFEESLTIHQQLFESGKGVKSNEYAETLIALAQLNRKQGEFKTAIEGYRLAIDVLTEANQIESEEMAVALNGLANVEVLHGNHSSAKENMLKAIGIHEKILGEEHSYFTIYLNNLSILLIEMEQYDEAFGYSRRALEIQKKILSSDHPYLSSTLRSLGKIAHFRGRLNEAEDYFLQALAINKARTESGNYITAVLYLRLGLVLQDQDKYQQAKESYEQMLSIFKNISAGESIVGRSLCMPASLAFLESDYSTAENYYRKALKILPEDTMRTTIAQLGYAQVLIEFGRLSEAEALVSQVLKIRREKLSSEHSLVAEAEATRGLIFSLNQQHELARKIMEPAIMLLEKQPIYGFGHRKKLMSRFKAALEKAGQ